MSTDEVLAFYEAEYLGEPVPPEDFPRLYARALDALRAATFGRLDSAPEAAHDAIMRALCSQIEWLVLNGVNAGHDEGSGSTFVVGHVTLYSSTSGKSAASVLGGLCSSARMLLMPTGLLYNGGMLL